MGGGEESGEEREKEEEGEEGFQKRRRGCGPAGGAVLGGNGCHGMRLPRMDEAPSQNQLAGSGSPAGVANRQNLEEPNQRLQYSIPGILHFIQHEWARFEMERSQWELERAELQVCFLAFIPPCGPCFTPGSMAGGSLLQGGGVQVVLEGRRTGNKDPDRTGSIID